MAEPTAPAIVQFRDGIQAYLDKLFPKLHGLQRQLLIERSEAQDATMSLVQQGIDTYTSLQSVTQGVRDSLNVLIQSDYPNIPKVKVSATVLEDLRENQRDINASMEVFEVTELPAVGGEVIIKP